MLTIHQKPVFLLYTQKKKDFVTSIPENILPYLELTYCFFGEMQYYCDGEHIVLHDGDAIVVPQGSVRQRLETHTPTYYASFNVQFPAGTSFPIKGLVPKAVRHDTQSFLEAFRKDYSSVSAYHNEKCALIFSYLFFRLAESLRDTENPHVQAIKQYIMDHISYEILLEDIAEAVHLAPHYCCTLFKKHTGMTIMQYVVFQRIDYAKRLIITKDWPLSRIACSSGFPDYYYFSRTFKKLEGITAAAYRKQSRMK